MKGTHRTRPSALPTANSLMIVEGIPIRYVPTILTYSSPVMTIWNAARLAESDRVSYDGRVVGVRVRR